MNIERMENFKEIDFDIKGPFLKDETGRIYFVLNTSIEGVKGAIDASLGFAVQKESEDKVRCIFSFVKNDITELLLDIIIDLKENKEFSEVFSQEKYYFALFYELNGKKYYAFSQSFSLTAKDREEILSMESPDYIITKKVLLSDIDLKPFLEPFFYSYRFSEKEADAKKFFNIVSSKLNDKNPVVAWFSLDKNGYVFYISESLGLSGEIVGANPLNEGALPFAIGKDKTVLVIVLDEKGIKTVMNISKNPVLYEKYFLWN